MEDNKVKNADGTVTVIHECECCRGIGTVDERLGGEPFSNPEATCPDCDGIGEWYETVIAGEAS